jgi:Mg-chelatase subunit ChlD
VTRALLLASLLPLVAGTALAEDGVPDGAEEPALASPRLELQSRLRVELSYPMAGAVVPDPQGCGAYVAGRAGVRGFDVLLVIDTSASAADPSGADIDADGQVGRAWLDAQGRYRTTDPGDSVLAAEVAAARQVLQELGAEDTRVGVVAFAGSDPRPLAWLFRRKPPARTLQALTADTGAVERALASILETDPEGGTDMAAAIDELARAFGGPGSDAPDLRRVSLFFTDGHPTLPYGPEEEASNVQAVLEAADRARRAGVEVHAFGIGSDALERPLALVEIAGRTAGSFTPVRHPADLVETVRHSGIGDLRSVTLRNLTLQRDADLLSVGADGAFDGFVPVTPGDNWIEIQAVSTRGAERSEMLALHVDPEAPARSVPPQLVARHTALLEECLGLVKRRNVEEVRRRLVVEIEEERARARARAEEQRKRLRLEIERAGP